MFLLKSLCELKFLEFLKDENKIQTCKNSQVLPTVKTASKKTGP